MCHPLYWLGTSWAVMVVALLGQGYLPRIGPVALRFQTEPSPAPMKKKHWTAELSAGAGAEQKLNTTTPPIPGVVQATNQITTAVLPLPMAPLMRTNLPPYLDPSQLLSPYAPSKPEPEVAPTAPALTPQDLVTIFLSKSGHTNLPSIMIMTNLPLPFAPPTPNGHPSSTATYESPAPSTP